MRVRVQRRAPQERTAGMPNVDQKQLACRWLMSPRTLEQWRWQGKGPKYLKIGAKVVYRLEDVEAFESESLRLNTTASVGAPSEIPDRQADCERLHGRQRPKQPDSTLPQQSNGDRGERRR
jgi:hypothetical protein